MSGWRDSIVRRLVVVTLVAGLVTGVVGLLLVQAVERRDLLADAAARNLAAAERTAALIDGRVETLEAQLRLLAATAPVATFDATAGDELAVALRVTEDLDQVVLYDLDGRPVAASSSATVVRAVDLGPGPVMDAPAQVDGYGPVGRVVTDGGLPHVEVVTAVEDPPGTRVGTLVGRAPVSLVGQVAETQLLGLGVRAFVTDDDGRLLATLESEGALVGDRFPVDTVFDDGRRVAVVERSGQSVVTAGVDFRTLPGWLVVEQAAATARTPDRTTIGDVTSVFLAVVLAIVTAVVVAGRQLLRPLRPLAEAVAAVGGGQRGIRLPTTGAGEAGSLQQGFNTMAAALEYREDALLDATRAASDSEQRLRLMVEGVADYAIVLLDGEGAVRSWNLGARRLFEVPVDQAVGHDFLSVLGVPRSETDLVALARTRGRAELETWCRRGRSERFCAAVVVTRLVDEQAGIDGFAALVHDLTDRRAAQDATERALDRERAAAAELRRANDLKDEFLAIAAHEIRTPLSAILGASSLLAQQDERVSEDEHQQLRGLLADHAEDLRQIVDRLLDFSRLQAGRVRLDAEPLRLADELARHVHLMGRHLQDHEVVFEVDDVEVVTDAASLRHVVTNLLSNAAKFSPAGTRIHVRGYGRTGEDGTPGEVCIEVADQGRGIPEADQERIFELFRQSSQDTGPARGTGVGLAIVERYVALLGGRVQVDSRPGEGAVFTVVLPRATADIVA